MPDQGSGITEHVDGFLSGKAGATWHGAIVIIRPGPPELWILRRPGLPDVGLGEDKKHATMALYAMRRAVPKAQ